MIQFLRAFEKIGKQIEKSQVCLKVQETRMREQGTTREVKPRGTQ